MPEQFGARGHAVPVAVRETDNGREPLYRKLKPGPGHAPERVVANQRARLCGAMVELVAEGGGNRKVTVRGLAGLAGVSTKSFYDCFANVEDCFVSTYGRILRGALKGPAMRASSPELRLRVKFRGFFEGLGADPKAASLVLVAARAAGGPDLRSKVDAVDRSLARFVAEELVALKTPPAVARILARGIVSAALQVARDGILNRRVATAELADDFADWVLALPGGHALPEQGPTFFDAPADIPTIGVLAGGDPDRHFLIAATTKLATRTGYSKLTIPKICHEAGVPRRTFDEHFDGVGDCFRAAMESKIADVARRAEVWALEARDWDRAVVRITTGLTSEVTRDPALGGLGLLTSASPEGPGLELRDRAIARWARRLRATAPPSSRPGRLAAEASVAAAAEIAAFGCQHGIGRVSPVMAYVMLAPAIGSSAAERQIGAELRSPSWDPQVRKHVTVGS
jgi:AcrR family transcriptional regulator